MCFMRTVKFTCDICKKDSLQDLPKFVRVLGSIDDPYCLPTLDLCNDCAWGIVTYLNGKYDKILEEVERKRKKYPVSPTL